METKNGPGPGKNRTGITMSPFDAAELTTGAEELTLPPFGDETSIAENRIRYMKEADPVGHVPIPGTPLIDKLGERLAFERSSVRLYEALISKHEGDADPSKLPPIELLRKHREEEFSHFMLAASALKDLGADPTALTPAANVAAVASQGLIQVLTDPRTNFAQSLEAILIAELTDNDSWDILIRLVSQAGFAEMAESFTEALNTEQMHLMAVRQWVSALNLGEPIEADAEGYSTAGLRTVAGEIRPEDQREKGAIRNE